MALLTGLGPCCTGTFLTSVLSWSSSWWLMSRVVKRLESRPRMWMMASLLEGLGCQGKESQSMTQTALLNRSHVFGMLRN